MVSMVLLSLILHCPLILLFQDVLYARERRMREKEEEDKLRDQCNMLTKSNIGLKAEEERLRGLLVSARTEAIKADARQAAFGTSQAVSVTATTAAVSVKAKASQLAAELLRTLHLDPDSVDLVSLLFEQMENSKRTVATATKPFTSFVDTATSFDIKTPAANASGSRDTSNLESKPAVFQSPSESSRPLKKALSRRFRKEHKAMFKPATVPSETELKKPPPDSTPKDAEDEQSRIIKERKDRKRMVS